MDTIYDAKLLIVDDNAELLALLCEQLRGAGYGHIRTAQSCAAARACFAAEQPELMILDINLPDGDGFSLFRALRAKADVPALFLSARDADADRLFGLGLGADDYLTKPFLMQELLLRLVRQRQQTILFVTHDVQEAVVVADRVLLLDPGSGTIRDEMQVGLDRPRDRNDVRFHACCARLHRWLRV